MRHDDIYIVIDGLVEGILDHDFDSPLYYAGRSPAHEQPQANWSIHRREAKNFGSASAAISARDEFIASWPPHWGGDIVAVEVSKELDDRGHWRTVTRTL